jgi:hypothetical protein
LAYSLSEYGIPDSCIGFLVPRLFLLGPVYVTGSLPKHFSKLQHPIILTRTAIPAISLLLGEDPFKPVEFDSSVMLGNTDVLLGCLNLYEIFCVPLDATELLLNSNMHKNIGIYILVFILFPYQI